MGFSAPIFLLPEHIYFPCLKLPCLPHLPFGFLLWGCALSMLLHVLYLLHVQLFCTPSWGCALDPGCLTPSLPSDCCCHCWEETEGRKELIAAVRACLFWNTQIRIIRTEFFSVKYVLKWDMNALLGSRKLSHGVVSLARLTWYVEPNRIGIIFFCEGPWSLKEKHFWRRWGEKLMNSLYAAMRTKLRCVKGEVGWHDVMSARQGRDCWMIWFYYLFFRYSSWGLVQINWVLWWIWRAVLHVWYQQRIDWVIIAFWSFSLCYLCTASLAKYA